MILMSELITLNEVCECLFDLDLNLREFLETIEEHGVNMS